MLKFFTLLCFPLLLTACSSPPLQYQNVIEPQAVYTAPIQSPHPVVALVLGSGGDRGFAHIGVIKVLEANGINVDMVLGTSAGSVVGALYAGGYNGVTLEKLALEMDREKLKDYDFSKRGYVRGEQLQDFINQALLNRSIEELPKPFIAIATQLSSGKTMAFNHGNTGMAVRASSSIPGIFLPVAINGEEYVDGDLKKPIPVMLAREMGADLIIAVDISQQPKNQPPPQDIIDILKQSLRIMRQSIIARELEFAQIVIRPEVSVTPEINQDTKLHLIKIGEEATTVAIPMIREWLQKIADEKAAQQALQALEPQFQ